MSDSNSAWQDEDFCPPEAVADPTLVDLADRIRTELREGGSCLAMIDEVRLYIMARFYQVPPSVITDELVDWGVESSYAARLVVSALATDRYDKRAELAMRMAAADDASRPADSTLAAMVQPTAPGARPSTLGYPDTCPVCDQVLYPLARLRPSPSMTILARLLLMAGIVVGLVTYLGGLLAIRSIFWLPMWLIVSLWFPIGLYPALWLGNMASRLPKVIRLDCRGCGWSEVIPFGKRAAAE